MSSVAGLIVFTQSGSPVRLAASEATERKSKMTDVLVLLEHFHSDSVTLKAEQLTRRLAAG